MFLEFITYKILLILIVMNVILVTEEGIVRYDKVVNISRVDLLFCVQIADFDMSRDLQKENYYIWHAKKIPI